MNKPTRRDFLKTTAVTGVGFWVAGGVAAQESKSPNEKLAVASVGVGGKGSSDIANAARWGNIVGLCDVDQRTLANAKESYPDAKTFVDFREMLEKMENTIDVVTVSAPDHIHAVAALMAMRMKKHTYVQKPLTRSIYEARLMGTVAKEMGVCTQMGNQGSSQNTSREAVAQIQAGMVGTIKDVHIWTNRPIWPQGLDVVGQTLDMFAAKAKVEDPDLADDLIAEMEEKIANDKKTLDWECWLGPAKYREYYPGIYHAFAWRGWWDFGSGALGDMACHTYNMPFYACDLRNPTSVQAITSGHNFDSFPLRSKIFYEFPATSKRPAITATWYDGGNKPSQELFEEVGLKEKVSDTGSLIIGDKGTLFSNDQ